MLDFLMISETRRESRRRNYVEIEPTFIVRKSKDLMIKGGDFYAVWDERSEMWSTDEETAHEQIDAELKKAAEKYKENGEDVIVKYIWKAKTGMIDEWHKYVQRQMKDNYHQLDSKVIFANTDVKKEDYVSRKLPYALESCEIDSYEELMNTLYSPEEKTKLEWAVGAIISGDSKKIQKFIVLYGSAGSGKSTFLNILQKIFQGYYSMFDAKVLASANNQFALESFKSNPLVAIQHDGDLSRIEDNTKLNSIVSHELMEINEKFKSPYVMRFDSFLFMGTNKPVKITEAKSGLIRRLIDVRPSGDKVPYIRYNELMKRIDFELGGIAKHCLDVYNKLGEEFYDDYIPVDMMASTNDFYDFVENYYDEFAKNDSISLSDAWSLYKTYCEYADVKFKFSMRQMRVELKNYFLDYKDQTWVDGKHIRNYYSGFKKEKFLYLKKEEVSVETDYVFEEQKSIFDSECSNCPAQYANDEDKPVKKWDDVNTCLKDIDTNEVHYVRPPENHIVIDFDLKDENGDKSFEKNLKAIKKWPLTYAELSKGGEGIHLHYIYDGDVSKLSHIYDEDIEIKVFTGKSSLRRRLSKCNDIPIRTINSGLPVKGEKNVIDFEGVKSEKALRTQIQNCLEKKHHGATKPEVDFIFKILEDAYNSGMVYDLSDMRPKVLAFANNSTNQAQYCVKLVNKMHFFSELEPDNEVDIPKQDERYDKIVFFDVEVFPNLFVVCWKFEGEDKKVVKMINPTPGDIFELAKYKLVGFNNKRYDNHILYARMIGYDNQQLYKQSQRLINDSPNATFKQAYNLSYTDIYDFTTKKQSLKKYEIDLDIHHQELGLKWDEEVPEELWPLVAEYCENDVIATEAVWNDRQEDWKARQILADLAGGNVNMSTNNLTLKIVFGDEKEPTLVYTDLATGEQWEGR